MKASCRFNPAPTPWSCFRFAALLLLASFSSLHAWTSAKVKYDANGRLFYPADANGNRIPDFSHAGYKGGGPSLPTVSVVKTISPIAGDNTTHIQNALDEVGAMAMQADGYRGALLLSAGLYQISGQLKITSSGVVLAGVGDGTAPSTNTIIRRIGTSTANVIVAGGGSDDSFASEIPNSRSQITTSFVQVGSRSFAVANPGLYQVGDEVIIYHPSTQAWINAVDQGGVTDGNYWRAGEIDIRYHRYITAISGSTITVDAPVFNHLDRSLSQSYLYKYDRTGVLTNIGIEDLFVEIVTNGETSEDHANNAVTFLKTENSWIRDCTMNHFRTAGVMFRASTRCTAARVNAIEPHSPITGGYRYNFATFHSQLILFKGCFASHARHSYITNGISFDSGIVVLDCKMDSTHAYAEGHRRWSTGILFDRLVGTNPITDGSMGFYNRGNWGEGHGWAAAHSVIWNSKSAGAKILVQRPPTAQNYAIGSFGDVTGVGPFPGTAGYREGSNTSGLDPQSLYEKQLVQRRPVKISVPGTSVIASANDGNVPANTVDGDLNTRWAANGDPQWIRYDLGSVHTVAYVRIAWYNGDQRSANFDLQVSNDGTNWTTLLANATSSGTTTELETIELPDTPARYVRYVGHGNSVNTWNAITEFEVRGYTPAKHIVPGSAVTASADDGNVANTVDGSLSTRWRAEGDPQWIRYDLGTDKTVTHLKIAWYKGDERTSTFDIQISGDGEHWTTLLTNATSSGTTTALETVELPDRSARYVRYVGHGNSVSLWNSITEFEVWGF